MSLEWDGVKRLGTWLETVTGCPGTPLNRAISRAWMVGMAGRALGGCKMDSVLVLSGPEGVGKSTVGSILGGEWFAEFSKSLDGDDVFYTLERRMVVELSELDSLSKSDATRIKALVSSSSDTFRRKYEAYASDRPRRCVFLGTTNEDEFLTKDMTMRRWWIIRTGSEAFKLAWLRQHRDLLLAEARVAVEAGELPLLPAAMRQDHAASVADAHMDHPYEELITEWAAGKDRFKMKEVVEGALQRLLSTINRYELKNVGTVLRGLGYTKTKGRDGVVWTKPSLATLGNRPRNYLINQAKD
jgi:putative DNA primase/helicase